MPFLCVQVPLPHLSYGKNVSFAKQPHSPSCALSNSPHPALLGRPVICVKVSDDKLG